MSAFSALHVINSTSLPLCGGLRTADLSGLDPEYRKIRVLRQKLAKLGVRRGVAGGDVDRRIQLAAD